MGKCPSCGNSSMFGVTTKNCAWCGKTVCNRCVSNWHGALNVKTYSEDVNQIYGQYQGALPQYATVGFCSDVCFYQFWEKALDYPVEYIIGTDVEGFHDNWIKYWNLSIVEAFSASRNVEAISKARFAVSIHSARFPAFPWVDHQNKPIWQAENSVRNARTALAQNLEKCGRTLDSAKEYESLRQYDKARELREKDKHIVIKKEDISLNINALLQQIKDNGLVAVYRCPHCGGKLKVDKNSDISKLKVCEHCGSEIEPIDLADFLKTALS